MIPRASAVCILFLAASLPVAAQGAPSSLRRPSLLMSAGIASQTSGSGSALPAAFAGLGAEAPVGSRLRLRTEGTGFSFFSGSPVLPACPSPPASCDELSGTVWVGTAATIIRPWPRRRMYALAGAAIYVAGRATTRGPKTRGGASVGLGLPIGDDGTGVAIELRYLWTARSLGRMRGLMPIAATFRF